MLALFAVILQGVLGGVTVLYKLPLAVSVTHACLAQVFFCLTVTLAVVTGEGWRRPLPGLGLGSGFPPQALATTALVFGQLVLGALMRHMKAGLAIPDFPLAFGRLVPPLVTPLITVHFAHRVGALVVLTAVWTLALRARQAPEPIRRPALLAAGLVVLQVVLGATIIWSQRAVVPTTTHVVVGAGILASCLVVTLRAFRFAPRRAAAQAPVGLGQRALA
jgi:cytochrome c oxidase assembly protein subunit 15